MTAEKTTEPAVGSQVERGVGRLRPKRASACGLTECQGKPECARCRRMADIDALCDLLPPQISNDFGHLLTPEALWGLYVDDGKPPNA